MGNDKGKGRAHDDDNGGDLQKNEPSQSSSMLSRVTASATGLTRSAFATPQNNELNERAAASLSDAGKGRQSSAGAGSSAWAESSRLSQPATHQAGGTNALRTRHNEEHVRQSETEFSSFLDGIDSFTPSEHVGDGQLVGGSMEDLLGQAWARAQPSDNVLSSETVLKTVAEQESHDGDEVLAILSDPVYDPFEAPHPEEEDYDWGLSAEQVSQLRAMTKDIFPQQEPHMAMSPDHPLNLIPNFDGVAGQAIAARETWREQWEGVLTRYTDDVWGSLLPIVKEARKEVEEIGNDPSRTEQPKALRRLIAIFGHLKQP
jgi:hypothetical protein